ncbi:MAG: hypothetical protein ACM3ZC_10190 [Bacteroidota bacterium]
MGIPNFCYYQAHELAHVWFGSSAVFDLREMRLADDATEQTWQ